MNHNVKLDNSIFEQIDGDETSAIDMQLSFMVYALPMQCMRLYEEK